MFFCGRKLKWICDRQRRNVLKSFRKGKIILLVEKRFILVGVSSFLPSSSKLRSPDLEKKSLYFYLEFQET